MRFRSQRSQNMFWAAAGPPGCWEWQGTRNKKGYGVTTYDGRQWRSHRLAWALINGPIPDGLFVLHRCSNQACVRPDHLYLGTNEDNMIDRATRSRPYRHNYKLSPAEVRDIRARYATGTVLQRELAEEYGVGQHSISKIVLGKSYRFDVPAGANRKKEITA